MKKRKNTLLVITGFASLCVFVYGFFSLPRYDENHTDLSSHLSMIHTGWMLVSFAVMVGCVTLLIAPRYKGIETLFDSGFDAASTVDSGELIKTVGGIVVALSGLCGLCLCLFAFA